MNEELMKALDDQEFAEKLVATQSAEEFVSVLESKNIKLADDITPEIAFSTFKNQESGEISVDELDMVSGGVVGTAIAIGAGIVLGVNAIAFAGGYIYQKVKNRKK